MKEAVKVNDYRDYLLAKYNSEFKAVANGALKTLTVMREILENIQDKGFSACFMRTQIESKDDDFEIFQRRMACRGYFKDLRLNMLA